MGALSPWHLILLLAILLLVLGPGRLPETGAVVGKAIRSFRDGVSEPLAGSTTANPANTGSGSRMAGDPRMDDRPRAACVGKASGPQRDQ
jgi:sec-independent protein translocase protein TatA